MVEDYSRACQREREERRKKKKEEERRRKKKKEEEEKSPEKTLCSDRDLNPRTLSPEPSVLSIRPQSPAQLTFREQFVIQEPISLKILRVKKLLYSVN